MTEIPLIVDSSVDIEIFIYIIHYSETFNVANVKYYLGNQIINLLFNFISFLNILSIINTFKNIFKMCQ